MFVVPSWVRGACRGWRAATMRKAVSGGGATKGDVAELKGEIGAVKAEPWAVKREPGLVLAIVPAMAVRRFGVVQGPRPDSPQVISHTRSAGLAAKCVSGRPATSGMR